MEIGANIESIRRDREMSIEDLSRESDVDPTHLKRIEAGQVASPGPDTLVRIAKGLGVEVGALFGEDGEVPKVELVMLSAPADVPGAFVAFMRNNQRHLTLDERVFLERVLGEVGTDLLVARQADFYDFWKDLLHAYRGSPHQSLLRLALGIHPDYGPETRDMIPQIWAVAEVMVNDLVPAAKRDGKRSRG
jgi:transcriptional regulator with XRE-family HTH domain